MEIIDTNYEVKFIEEEKKVVFTGSIRLSGLPDYEKIKEILNKVYDEMNEGDALTLDFSQLKFLNSSGITTLSMFIIQSRKKGKLNIKVIGTNSISWQKKSLNNFKKLWDKVEIVLV